MNKETRLIPYFFFHPNSSRTSSNCLSHKRLANGWPYRFHSKSTTGSSTEFRAILERPPFLPECQQISRRLLVRQPGNLAMTSITLRSSHLQNWWTLFSKHCTRYRIVLAISPRSTTNVWNLLSKKTWRPKWEANEKTSMTHYDLVRTFFSEAASDEDTRCITCSGHGMEETWDSSVLAVGISQKARRKLFWKHKNEKKYHSATLIDMCHHKNAELELQFQKYESRVVLRETLWRRLCILYSLYWTSFVFLASGMGVSHRLSISWGGPDEYFFWPWPSFFRGMAASPSKLPIFSTI